MTKLEELKAAYAAARAAAYVAEAANVAARNAAWDSYYAELKKTQEGSPSD